MAPQVFGACFAVVTLLIGSPGLFFSNSKSDASAAAGVCAELVEATRLTSCDELKARLDG